LIVIKLLVIHTDTMTTTSKIILWAIGILIVGLAVYYFLSPSSPADSVGDSDVVFCTMDAKQCPDGSYVGRTGPNCEFVCPSRDTSNNSGVPIVEATFGEDGTVTLSPADIGK